MMKEGAADYIVKDNILEELPVRVRQVLERRKLRQESTVLRGRIESLNPFLFLRGGEDCGGHHEAEAPNFEKARHRIELSFERYRPRKLICRERSEL